LVDYETLCPYSGQNNALEGEKIELKCSASKYDYSGKNYAIV
jgi:hypothetical protein